MNRNQYVKTYKTSAAKALIEEFGKNSFFRENARTSYSNGVSVDIYESAGRVFFGQIFVPEKIRRDGLATAIVLRLIDLSEKYKVDLLTAVEYDGEEKSEGDPLIGKSEITKQLMEAGFKLFRIGELCRIPVSEGVEFQTEAQILVTTKKEEVLEEEDDF